MTDDTAPTRRVDLDARLPGLDHVTVREALKHAALDRTEAVIADIEVLEAQRQAAKDAERTKPYPVVLPDGATVVLEAGKWYAVKGRMRYSSNRSGQPNSYPVVRFEAATPDYYTKEMTAHFEVWPKEAAAKEQAQPGPLTGMRGRVSLPVSRIAEIKPYDESTPAALTMIRANYQRWRARLDEQARYAAQRKAEFEQARRQLVLPEPDLEIIDTAQQGEP